MVKAVHVEESNSSNTTNISKHSNDLAIKRKGGGCIIDCKPVFSLDTELLYVVWGSVIRAYGVQTGELVRHYEGVGSRLVGVQLHPTNPHAIVACTEGGELIQWDWRSGLQNKKVKIKLKENEEDLVFVSLHLLTAQYEGEVTNKCIACVRWKKRDEDRHSLTLVCTSSGRCLHMLKIRVDGDHQSVACGGKFGSQYIAAIDGKHLMVTDVFERNLNRYRVGIGQRFTCVACHPEEKCVATGDAIGRIILWQRFSKQDTAVTSVYHWHTLPVRCIAFSQAGSHFYSGAGECVLVKWTIEDALQKQFLPRLSAPICHLALGSDNKFLAISTADNGIRIIDAQFHSISTVQHLTWSIEKVHGLPLFPAGITVDPRSKAIVLNGRTGHIQFYSCRNNILLYNLDITCQNYLTQERHEVIVNTDVTKIALSCDGLWLATVERRDDGEANVELRLKFWNFDSVKQKFCLNTVVEMPHKNNVLALEFQPSTDHQYMAATTGDDSKFRIWCLTNSTSIYKKGQVIWQCESVGFYRNLPACDISFSLDGSLMGVTFGPMLTIWVPDTTQLKCSLTQPRAHCDLSHVEFGREDCSHLVVTGSKESLNVWNLLTLSLTWTVPLNVNLLTADPCSRFMAAFTADNSLFVFSPACSELVYKHDAVVPKGSSVLAAAFVPHPSSESASSISWQKNSELFFLDSNQELLTLDTPDDIEEKDTHILPVSSMRPLTPFGTLLAKKTTSDVEKLSTELQKQLGVPGEAALKEFISVPSHTMAPVSLLCGSLLRALVPSRSNLALKRKLHAVILCSLSPPPSYLSTLKGVLPCTRTYWQKEQTQDKGEREEMEVEDSDVDSENESSKEEKIKLPVRKEKEDNDSETNSTFQNQDLEKKLSVIMTEPSDWSHLFSEQTT